MINNKIKKIASLFGILIIGALGAFGGMYAYNQLLPEQNAKPSLSTTNDGNSTVTTEESSIAAVAEKVGPSVVSIVTSVNSQSIFGTSTRSGSGTGIIVSKDGYIMTNNHVIEGAKNVSVVDSDGRKYDNATVLGRDPLNDIAFLKIESDKEFKPIDLGDSSTIRIGQQVVAIGNALGRFSNTVTSGIISGTGRPVTASSGSGGAESLTDLIQTDTSINPGNSGGPLVNLAGQVIGINTAIVDGANGIGFSIPINSTKGILAGILENGKVERAFLGLNYITITPDIAREYDLSVNMGAYIYAADNNPIADGSPADKAGLKAKDIITKINNKQLGKQGALSSLLGEYRPGDKITITYLRDGKEQSTDVNLGRYGDEN